jgi:hypothetical protein
MERAPSVDEPAEQLPALGQSEDADADTQTDGSNLTQVVGQTADPSHAVDSGRQDRYGIHVFTPSPVPGPRQSSDQTETDAGNQRGNYEVEWRHINARTNCQQRITASGKKMKATTSAIEPPPTNGVTNRPIGQRHDPERPDHADGLVHPWRR